MSFDWKSAVLGGVVGVFGAALVQTPLERWLWDEPQPELRANLSVIQDVPAAEFNAYGFCNNDDLAGLPSPLMLTVTALNKTSDGFGVSLSRTPRCLGVQKGVTAYDPEGFLMEFEPGDSLLVNSLRKDQAAKFVFWGISASDVLPLQSDLGATDIQMALQ